MSTDAVPAKECHRVVETEDDAPVAEGRVMTEAEVDRMRILSWWDSYSRRGGQ